MKSRRACAAALVTAMSFVLFTGGGARAQGNALDLVRGDADLNDNVELTDAISVLSFLFLGGELLSCTAIADATANGVLDLTDPVFVLNHLFLGGPAPPPLSGFENRTCQEPDAGSIAEGETVYLSPDPQSDNVFEFSCATCHDSVPADQQEMRRPGHTLHDAIRRSSFKNGQITEFLGAANVCREDWLLTTAWTDGSEDFLDLVSYLHSLTPVGTAPTYTHEISAPVNQGPSNGDVQIGCELFHDSCVVCHGPNASGSPRAPGLFFPKLGEVLYDPDFLRAKVRLSGPVGSIYPGLEGGVMPFWTQEQLSDDELEHVVAYLMQIEPSPCP